MQQKPVIYTVLLLTILFLYSCGNGNNKLIIGKWRSVKIENHDKDNFFRNSQQFIDTMGKGNTDSVNIAVYGVANVDSLRRELQKQFDSAYAAQESIDTQSIFTFNEDSTVIFSFPGKNESGKWYIDKKGKLILDETNELGETEQLSVEITELKERAMKLTFIRELEEGISDTSIVTFQRQD